jgi:hypothetical protein
VNLPLSSGIYWQSIRLRHDISQFFEEGHAVIGNHVNLGVPIHVPQKGNLLRLGNDEQAAVLQFSQPPLETFVLTLPSSTSYDATPVADIERGSRLYHPHDIRGPL